MIEKKKAVVYGKANSKDRKAVPYGKANSVKARAVQYGKTSTEHNKFKGALAKFEAYEGHY